MTCPVCDAHTSNVAWAASQGEPCPYCGATPGLIWQIAELRERRGDEQLKAELEQALIKLDQVTRERNKLARIVQNIRTAVIASDAIELLDAVLYPSDR